MADIIVDINPESYYIPDAALEDGSIPYARIAGLCADRCGGDGNNS